MENLVPRAIYAADDTGYWRRLPLFAGIGFGIPMGIFFVFMVALMGWGRIGPAKCLYLGISGGILAGVLFGFLFPVAFRRKMSLITDALYSEEAEVITSSTPDIGLRYRLPCNWMRSESFAVGGVMYIGSRGFLFAPRGNNLPRDGASFEMGPVKQLKLSLVPTRLTGWKRLLVPRPAPQLRVNWPGGDAKFLIPQPQQTLILIEDALRGLR